MFGSSRGGVRGGQDQFNWEDVKTDKQRENYLGEHGAGVGLGTRAWGLGANRAATRTRAPSRRQLTDGPSGPLAEGP